jgi:hypothetical protein
MRSALVWFVRFLAMIAAIGSPSQVWAVGFTGVYSGAGQWSYTLTFDPLDNYSIFQPTTTITLSGLCGVVAAGPPTRTDFPYKSLSDHNLQWTAVVVDSRTVRWTHVGPGTGNFSTTKHTFGFTVTAPTATPSRAHVVTSGFSRDRNRALHGAFNVDINGATSGPANCLRQNDTKGPSPRKASTRKL